METSNISWTDGTWNPWMGCDKVGGPDSECANCYIGRVLGKQGLAPWGQVYRTQRHTWNLPYRMERKAVKEGRRYKLFTCSLSDWFHRGADLWRAEAWKIVRECPHVDFLILTKRAHRITPNLPGDWTSGYANVWLGVSVGRMNSAHRIDKLRAVPALTRFISAEPLLESLAGLDLTNIDWLIAGGESGDNFRDMDRVWAEELRKKCEAAGVAFFFKQASGYKSGMHEDLLGQVHHNWPVTITIPPTEPQPKDSTNSLALPAVHKLTAPEFPNSPATPPKEKRASKCKLSAKNIAYIKVQIVLGTLTYKALAEKFGVSVSTISKLRPTREDINHVVATLAANEARA